MHLKGQVNMSNSGKSYWPLHLSGLSSSIDVEVSVTELCYDPGRNLALADALRCHSQTQNGGRWQRRGRWHRAAVCCWTQHRWGRSAGLWSTASSCQERHGFGWTVAMKGQVCRPTGSENGHVALNIWRRLQEKCKRRAREAVFWRWMNGNSETMGSKCISSMWHIHSPSLTFSLLLSTLLSSTLLSNPTLMMTWTLSGLQFPGPAVTWKEALSLVKWHSLNASHGEPVVPLWLSAINYVVLTAPPLHSRCNNRLFFIVKLTAEYFAKAQMLLRTS